MKMLVALIGRRIEREIQEFAREHGPMFKKAEGAQNKEENRIFTLDLIIKAVELLNEKAESMNMETKMLVALIAKRIDREIRDFIKEHGPMFEIIGEVPNEEEARFFALNLIRHAAELLKRKKEQ